MASLKLLVVLMMAAVMMVNAGGEEKLLKKYAMIKIFDSCFGEEQNKAYMKKGKEAALRCRMQPTRDVFSTSGSSSGFNTRNSGDQIRPLVSKLQNSPVTLQGFDWSAFFAQAAAQQTKYGNIVPIPVAYVPESQGLSSRRKRATTYGGQKYFNADRIRKLTTKIEAKISNLTCVMRDLGYMDDRNEMRYDSIKREIIDVRGIDTDLREDLLEAVDECQQMAMCMPSDKQSPMKPSMKRFKIFYKCNMKMKFLACMKKDLRSKSAEFDLSGLGDAMSGADDDEKMLAILWGKTVVGGDDYMF